MKNIRILNANSFLGKNNVITHVHEGTEFILVTKGNCGIDVKGVHLKGAPDSLFIIPPETLHNQINHAHTMTNYISFKLYGKNPFNRPCELSLAGDKWLSRWITDIVELYRFSHEDVSVQTCSILLAIIERLKTLIKKPLFLESIHPSIMKAVKFIEEDISRELTVNAIASRCGVSASYLNILFKKHFGYGPLKYLQSLRMRYARRLLTDPYMPIKQIGIMCGYDDVNYFCRLFRKNNNISPGQFRLQSFSKQKQTREN
ncbi:MAG: hypothetical protein A2017_08015 [Lentisphaerae bacterium GWF2_44_16]|nr:MAG: hypothetical protein A2017_08015 [Lentisphaerae bacterium GWF2_44_16]